MSMLSTLRRSQKASAWSRRQWPSSSSSRRSLRSSSGVARTFAGDLARGGQRQQEAVVEQRRGLDAGMLDGKREEHDVELAVDQFVEQLLRLRLAQMQIEIGIGGADQRQKLRQQIGRDGGNGAEAQRAGEAAGELARAVDEVVDVGEHAGGALGDLAAAGVRLTPLRPRSSSCRPSSFSRSWTCMESAGCVTAQCSAAAPKCPVCATALK